MALVNLASLRECTESEGPGRRFAVWAQGCERRCPGCCNPRMQAIAPRRILDSAEVTRCIERACVAHDLNGVTFVGGEPFLQAEGMAEIAEQCQKMGLSVLAFTGYTLSELQSLRNEHVERFLRYIDLLVDGPFCQESPDLDRGWIGSTNQVVWRLTDRFPPGIEYAAVNHDTEILISDTTISINGWPIDSGIDLSKHSNAGMIQDE